VCVCVCVYTYEELPGEHLIPAGITQRDDATKSANRNHILYDLRVMCVVVPCARTIAVLSDPSETS